MAPRLEQPVKPFRPLKQNLPRVDESPQVSHQRRDESHADPPDDPDEGGREIRRRYLIAKESGGEYFSIDNLDQLPDVIPSQDRTIPQLTSPEPIWGMPEVRREFLLICFFLPFVLLTIEWALRKAYRLL